MATRQPITQSCSPGVVDRVYLQSSPVVVELVRSNLAPDFPLFHDTPPLYAHLLTLHTPPLYIPVYLNPFINNSIK